MLYCTTLLFCLVRVDVCLRTFPSLWSFKILCHVMKLTAALCYWDRWCKFDIKWWKFIYNIWPLLKILYLHLCFLWCFYCFLWLWYKWLAKFAAFSNISMKYMDGHLWLILHVLGSHLAWSYQFSHSIFKYTTSSYPVLFSSLIWYCIKYVIFGVDMSLRNQIMQHKFCLL